MPGQTGTENRRRQIVRSTRWDEEEFAQLRAISDASQCSEAEALRRLVRRASRNVILSRDLVAQVRKLGVNVNQIAHRLNDKQSVHPEDLLGVYRELLALVTIARS